MIAAFFEGLAEFVVRFRVAVVVFWVIVTAVAMLALPALGSEVNSDPSLFLSPGAKSVEAAALGTPLLGRSDRSKVTVVAARADAPLTSADLAALDREGKLARGVAGVDSVRPGAVSPDGKAVEIDVSVSKEAKDVAGLKPVVTAIQRTFAEAAAPPGLQLHLAGNVATNVANNTSTNKATRKIGYLSILFIVVLLMIVLRSPVAALVTFLPSVAALLLSQKLIAGLGASGLQISSVTQTLLVVLMLGAGTDYGLFLVYRFREELGAGTEPRLAVVRALTRVGESITASAGTVILALLTLLLASFGLYHDLGLPLATGIAVMLLAGLTLLPALLALAAPLMFAGRAPRRGVEGGSSPLGQAQFAGLAPRDRAGRGEGLWGRVAARAVRRPGLTLGAGALIFAALALAAFGYRTAGLNRSTTAPAGSDAAAGNALVAEYFPQSAVSPADLILHYATPAWQSPGPLTVAQASLRSSGLFSTLAGPLDPNGAPLSPAAYAAAHAELGSPKGLPLTEPANIRLPRGVYNAYRATAQYVSADGRTVRFAAGLRAGDQQSSGAMNATPAVRAAVTAAARRSGAEVSGVTGQAAALYDVSAVAGSDVMRIIPVAVLAIAVLLGLVLRSLVAPLYLVVSIVASYLAALGGTTLLVIDLGGQSGLIFILPFLMFVFLLALGEDYNILVMTRIREEARHLPLREAVVRAVGKTGPTVTSAGLILAGTFGVYALAGGGAMGGQLRSIGLGLALGILLDTFVVRTLLVPSAVVLLGRGNWWPSRLGRAARPTAPAVPARASPG